MIAYCMVIDGSLSAVRAVTMFVIHMAGVYLGRTYDVRTALCFAGLLCVIDNPQVVYNGGFWLSYGCVMSVVGIPGIKGLPKPLSGAGVTISIFAGTLPILLWFYYEVSPWGLVLNILVIPLISLCLAGGILGILLPTGLGLLGMGISFGVDLMVKCVCFLCGLVTKLGAGTFITGKPGVLMVALYYCLLLLFVNPTGSKRIGKIPGKIRRYAFTAAVFLILLFSGNHQKKVTFLDVGQGDGAVILKGKEAYLIDGGSSSVKSVGKNRILPYLKYEGVREIKTVFLSHPDEDHLNGSAELIKECKDIRIDSVCISECIKDEWISKYPDLLNACLAEEIRIYPISTGYRIRDGDLTITCIYPENDRCVTDTNSGSEVLFVEYGKEVFLFTGDLDKEGENRVAAFLSTVKGFNGTDFLKVSHHGSRYSTYAPFLETVNPKFSVISVGRNSYGHPARETLERLSDSGSRCLRTDICGALTVTVGRNKTIIRKFKK